MIKYIIGLISAGGLFLAGLCLMWVEAWLFENQLNVSPLPGVRQQEWLQSFGDIAFYQLIIALVFTIGWHTIGYFHYRINDWSKAGGRLLWGGLFITMMIFNAISGWLTTEPTQDPGRILAVLAYVINSAFIYYASSLFFSPTTVKYIPLGAIRLHKIWS